MQKSQEQQSKKSPASTYNSCPHESLHLRSSTSMNLYLLPAEVLQKSPAVRPKDSAHPVNWKEPTEEQQADVQEELAFKDQTVYSYQQISCLDSVIRYEDRNSQRSET